MNATMVAFPSRDAAAFVRDIKTGVAAYFELNRRSPKGNWSMWVKTFLLFAVVAGSYAAIMSNRFSPLAMARTGGPAGRWHRRRRIRRIA